MNEPIACSLSASDLGMRHERWLVLGSKALVGIDTKEQGLELVFASEPGVEAEVRDLAELERECCAFASWEVSTEADRVVLDVRGDGEAVPVVQRMFDRSGRSSPRPARRAERGGGPGRDG